MTDAMEAVFYRGIDPSHMGYIDLRFYLNVHERIVAAEKKAAGV